MWKLTNPVGGMVNVTPLKLTDVAVWRMPGTEAGTGPEPESTVSETSVAFEGDIRLVTLTLRTTPGVPWAQLIRMSPTTSVIPSARNCGFPAPVEQLNGEDWGRAIPAARI